MKKLNAATPTEVDLPTGELKVDFDKPAKRFTWVHVILLIVSLYVFLILPIIFFVVNVLPRQQSALPVNKASTSQGAARR
ncbi:MAG: hypothetical protein ABL949_15060 [Fimbriimonadaceae bacterium]